jgi:REP element-mobilizing transposase RayT
MYTISPASPAYFLTSVVKDRLPVFGKDEIKEVATSALNEARTSGQFLIFAYVIMPDHLHLVTGGKPPSLVLRFTNGLVARRCIDYLKQKGYASSLAKLRHGKYRDRSQYSLWDHHPNVRKLWSESMLMQRVNYTHKNPVRAGLVQRAEDYRFSSARLWAGKRLANEPLEVDLEKIQWRSKAKPSSKS